MRAGRPVSVFIVGAAKAGTTTLYKALDNHPDVFMSAVKEPNYFSADELKVEKELYSGGVVATAENYKKMFSKASAGQLLGEASVSYLAYPSAAKRIFEYNPEAKIIISLREPVSRAVSHHAMEQRLGYCKVPLKTIFYDEENYADFHRHYFQNSLYYAHVSRFIETFGREQVLILLFDDLHVDEEQLLRRLFAFLGIGASRYDIPLGNENQGKVVKNQVLAKLYQRRWLRIVLKNMLSDGMRRRINNMVFDFNSDASMDKATLQEMHAYFQADVGALETLLDLDLSAWTTSAPEKL